MRTSSLVVRIIFFSFFQCALGIKIISIEKLSPAQPNHVKELNRQDLRLKIEAEFLKDSVLPDGDEISFDNASPKMEYIAISSQPRTLLKQTKKLILSRYDYALPAPTTTKRSLRKKRQTSLELSEWGEFSCCRRAIGMQTRQRMVNSRYLQVQLRECSWDYCKACIDTLPICDHLRAKQSACKPESHYRGFMSRNCPNACGWCNTPTSSPSPQTSPETTTSVPATTTQARQTPDLRRVRVFMKKTTPAYTYQFTTSSVRPRYPWRTLARSDNPGEVANFYLHSRPTGRFQKPIYFCKAGRNQGNLRSLVSRRPCPGAWKTDMVLFATNVSLPNTKRLLVANRGKAPWTSRIFKNSPPCCGYKKSVWSFYAPVLKTSTKPTNSPVKPTTSSSTTDTDENLSPSVSTTPSPFDKECLEYHNFFRAAHGVPQLKWDPALTSTAQKWANYLANNAPEHPFQTKPDFERTQSWPHSQRDTQYRGRGVGENIAWDFSPSGSPAKESVLRWYAEIFDHDRAKPTFSEPGKPIGHYTQMLWGDSDYVGCAVAVRNITRGSFTYQSTYAVAHYAPSGNVHYPQLSQTHAAYNKNVPAPVQGTCMSPESCSVYDNEKSRCMGFNENMSCGCSRNNAGVFGGRPQCKGKGGCIVSCKKPPVTDGPRNYFWASECQGETSCECIYTPSKGRAGAICS